jgi:hypothetical protein
MDYLVTNNPSKLLILIPTDLEVGVYRLRIVTQFSSGKHLLNMPRESVFAQELTIIE